MVGLPQHVEAGLEHFVFSSCPDYNLEAVVQIGVGRHRNEQDGDVNEQVLNWLTEISAGR
jgi:hypothetical protein